MLILALSIDVGVAKADGTYPRTLAKFRKFDLLILDDLGMGQLREAQRHDPLEVL